MKQLLVLGFAIAMVYMVASCSPTVNSTEPPNALDTSYLGTVTATGGLRTYKLWLTCGCPFAMRVDSADTSAIKYNLNDIRDTTSPHYVIAAARTGLASGTHIGFIALHMAPPSLDTFHVVLRDTVVIP